MPVTWLLVASAYVCHALFALRCLDLATPDPAQPSEMDEAPGRPWWPNRWKIPSAFANSLWQISPPKKLEGQSDLLHESEALANSLMTSSLRRRKIRDVRVAEDISGSVPHTTRKQLHERSTHLQELFEAWFSDATWQRLSPAGRGRLVDMHSKFLKLWQSSPEDDKTQREHRGGHRQRGNLRTESSSCGSTEWERASVGDVLGDGGRSLDSEDRVARVAVQLHLLEDAFSELEHKEGIGSSLHDVGSAHHAPGTDEHIGLLGDERAQSSVPATTLKVVIMTVICCWLFLVMGAACDAMLGADYIMKWPGHHQRCRASQQPGNACRLQLVQSRVDGDERATVVA